MKTLMIQGTASNSGKSLIVAAICRMLFCNGYRVAPFKAHNLSDKAYTTPQGKILGYAQYIQACGCGAEISELLNPVLICPSGHQTRFVINGEVVHTGPFSDYSLLVPRMKEAISNSFHTLSQQYDWIIIEGAGSPAEINRQQEDLANHYTASLTDSPVVLISNIELGGAFASVAGTLELLSPAERARIKGFVFNKYDGPLSLLEPGNRILEKRYGIPFLGAVPYLEGLHIPEEDRGTYNSAKGTLTDTFSLKATEASIDRLSLTVQEIFSGWF